MVMKVAEAHPLVYHYTTTIGLKGIIESQQIHATSITYLNDSEEHSGFFDRRLPKLIDQPVKEAIHEAMQSPSRRSVINEAGGTESAEAKLHEGFLKAVRETTLTLNDPYVASFSAPPKDDVDDGLLSQWRAYGSDGGYAIVFESAGLDNLLRTEVSMFLHELVTWGDVDYYDQGIIGQARHPETRKNMELVRLATKNYFLSGKQVDLEQILVPLTQLSVLHKHRGFREEEEIRIVSLRAKPEVEHLIRKEGESRPLRPIRFRSKSGMLIPYIELFGKELGEEFQLPIKRVIVGPHADRDKRRISVENLLRQNGVNAEVTVSSIPYLGT